MPLPPKQRNRPTRNRSAPRLEPGGEVLTSFWLMILAKKGRNRRFCQLFLRMAKMNDTLFKKRCAHMSNNVKE